MAGQSTSLLGVIEGFYGRAWPHHARLDYAAYLQFMGLNSYLYCPKSDPFLRRRWQEDWPTQTRNELRELASTYARTGIYWGVGLSPFALYENYDKAAKQALQRKVTDLAELGMPLLAILFDDMPGELDQLAAIQSEIVADVCGWFPGARILICPTYYSFDPVLEKFFGARPKNYWRDLGAALPEAVEIFWTGNYVCSESIEPEDIDAIGHLLNRRVVLWDNYPVNDGAVRSNYLYSEKLPGRDARIKDKIAGHFCNPMNQPLLSLAALQGLAELHGTAVFADDSWLQEVYGSDSFQQLQRDKHDFEALGLSGLGESRRRELTRLYCTLPGNAAAEVAAWLGGEYTFDPACLTD